LFQIKTPYKTEGQTETDRNKKHKLLRNKSMHRTTQKNKDKVSSKLRSMYRRTTTKDFAHKFQCSRHDVVRDSLKARQSEKLHYHYTDKILGDFYFQISSTYFTLCSGPPFF